MALVEPPELAPTSQLVIHQELEAAEAEQDHRQEEEDGTSEFPTLHRRALSASSINSSASRRDVMRQHGSAAGGGGPSSLSVGVARRGNAPVSRGRSPSPSPSAAAAAAADAMGSLGRNTQGLAAPPPASLSHLSAEAAGARSTAPRSVSPRPASPLDAQHPQQQQIDKLLLEGLRVSKDRILILKSDLEIERFVEDPQRSRMRCIPPAFPPALNSYQRLLIHRLADMWGVTRELESPPSPAYAQQGHVAAQGGIAAAQSGASSLSSNGPPGGVGGFAAPSHAPAAHSTSKSSVIDGIIVLVKTERTRHPSVRISSLVPPMPVPASAISPISLIRQPQSHPSPSMTSSIAPSLPSSIAGSSVGSLGSPHLATQQDEQSEPSSAISPTSQAGPIRIMARASNGSASGSRRNSPVARGAAGQNTALTFEEREAAYQEARHRIFNQSGAGPSSASTYPAQQVQPQPYMAVSAPQVDLPTSMSAPPADLPVYAYQAYPPTQSSNAMVVPPNQEAYIQQNSNALRPSAPTFVYQPVPVSTPGQGQGQPQQYAYYAVPVQVQGVQQMAYPQSMQHLAPHEQPPPIQITMSSPAMQYAQHLPPPNFASATPSTSLPDGESASMSGHVVTQAAQPRSRPQSTRSHSSRSSISTTTSTSSIRTASTSSAVQRLNNSLGSVPISPLSDLRPMRQTSSASSSAAGSGSRPPGRQSKDHKPVQGQQRPALTNVGGSANSAASGNSRHSRSSSSVSTSTGTSVSGSLSVLSAGGRSTGTTSGSTRSRSQDKGKGREREAVSLPEAQASLPAKPISNSGSGHSSTSSEAADRSTDSDPHQLLEGDETEMDGEGEGAGDDERLAEAVVRTVTLDDVLESKKEKRISSSLTPPAAPSSAASDAGSSSIAPSESASQRPKKSAKRNAAQAAAQDSTHANPRSTPLSAAIQQQQQQHSQQQPAQAQQKIVEYPPLRYDREKGWTALHPTPGGTVVSLPQPSISRGPSPAPGGLQRKTSRGKGYRPGATPPAGSAYMMAQGPAAMHLPVHSQQQQQQQQQHAIYFTTQPPHQRQSSSQDYAAPHQLQYIPAIQQAVSPGEAPGSSYQPPPQFFYAQPYQPSFDGSGGQGQPQLSHPHQQYQLVPQQPVHYAMPGQQMHASHVYPGQSSSINGQQYIAVPAQYAPVPGNPAQQPEYYVQQPYYYQPQPQMQMMAPASSAPQPMLHQPDHERQQSRSPRPAHQQQGQPYPVYAASAPPQPLPGQPMYHVHPMGAMTQAELVASGEMLYSYDIPRPVPRSGATLFDPNARAATT